MAVRDETDKLQATILFSLYDTNKDGVLDEEEFVQLVADLLCLRGNVLEVTPAVAYKLARPLAFHGILTANGSRLNGRAELTGDLFAALANRGWARVMEDDRIAMHLPFWRPGPNDAAPWVPDILELNDPALPERIDELRRDRQRGPTRRVASSSRWVHDQPLKPGFHGQEVEWLDEKLETSHELDKFELVLDPGTLGVHHVEFASHPPSHLCRSPPAHRTGDKNRARIYHTVVRSHQLAPEIEYFPVRRMARSMADVTPPKFSPPRVARKSSDASANPPPPTRTGDIRRAVNNHLRALGGRPRDRGADGNCFFLSLCGSLGEPLSNHRERRRQTVEYLRVHRARLENFIEGDFDQHCNEMVQDGAWVGHVEVQAAADALNLDIRIYQDDDSRDQRIEHRVERNGMWTPERNMDTRDAFLALYQIPGSEHYVEFEGGHAPVESSWFQMDASWFQMPWTWATAIDTATAAATASATATATATAEHGRRRRRRPTAQRAEHV
mmetsp:Transcript_48275/g.135186  ORF Transcript_48275/g.135186 Transcript_48275/m.135186 type:complete len:500 (-) Transcript_48275:1994-3493(-)